MNHNFSIRSGISLALSFLLATTAYAASFNSGSTGADGDFNPTTNTTLTMPANGVFNFGNVNIPSGVTVTFAKNAANTPVIMLASGSVTIAGSINISGGNSSAVGTGIFGDMGSGGKGGPGGFDGAHGGQAGGSTTGGTGMGPGGGAGGIATPTCGYFGTSFFQKGGGGGGFGADGVASVCAVNSGVNCPTQCGGAAGKSYGSVSVLPLVGGSGGGGGAGAVSVSGYAGTGGGGGGGALLIAASGNVSVTGSIVATGGASGKPNDCAVNNTTNGGAGGGGSGGAVRILAPSFSGSGLINVNGGSGRPCGTLNNGYADGGNGSVGRSSVETVTGGTLRLTGLPGIAITNIGGVDVPAQPTGSGDVVLAPDLPNPVTVNISASSIPLGTVVKVTLYLSYGAPTVVNSTPLAGTYAASTATASITIPQGSTVMIASTTYTLTLAMGEALSVYAMGERVEKVELASTLGGGSKTTLITVSGKSFEVPAAVLATVMG